MTFQCQTCRRIFSLAEYHEGWMVTAHQKQQGDVVRGVCPACVAAHLHLPEVVPDESEVKRRKLKQMADDMGVPISFGDKP